MVRHQQHHMRPPESLILAMADRFKQTRRNGGDGKLVGTAPGAIHGDEINRFLRVNPQRDVVRQAFSLRKRHDFQNRDGERCNRVLSSKQADIAARMSLPIFGRDGALRRPIPLVPNGGHRSAMSLPRLVREFVRWREKCMKAVGKPSMMPTQIKASIMRPRCPLVRCVHGMSTITGMMITAISENPNHNSLRIFTCPPPGAPRTGRASGCPRP